MTIVQQSLPPRRFIKITDPSVCPTGGLYARPGDFAVRFVKRIFYNMPPLFVFQNLIWGKPPVPILEPRVGEGSWLKLNDIGVCSKLCSWRVAKLSFWFSIHVHFLPFTVTGSITSLTKSHLKRSEKLPPFLLEKGS